MHLRSPMSCPCRVHVVAHVVAYVVPNVAHQVVAHVVPNVAPHVGMSPHYADAARTSTQCRQSNFRIPAISMTTLNSTFAQLSPLDQAALYLPQVIYQLNLNANVLSSALLVLSAVALVTAGSYATVCQPKTAKDPCDDKNSPLWDVTDRDNCPLYFTLADQAQECNSDLMGAKTVILLVAGATAMMYGLNYILQHYDISVLRVVDYYLVVMVIPTATMSLQWVLGVLLRRVAYLLGLTNNLAYFFPRFRIAVSSEDSLPAGLIEPFDERKLGLDPRTVEHYERWMFQNNSVQVLRALAVPGRKQKVALVADARLPLALAAALVLLAVYYTHNPQLASNYNLPRINWIVNNAVAGVFAFCGCRQLRATSFAIAALLLSALFVYDVYFVFATPMMEAVAMGTELPLKLVFPQSPHTIVSLSDMWTVPYHQLVLGRSILGLGDIVIPCVFISLCLRFDYSQFYKKQPLAFHHLRSIGVPVYFCTAIASYTSALVASVIASQLSGRGQPALLYIVPALFTGVWAVAATRGEIHDLSAFSEVILEYPKAGSAGKPVAEASGAAIRDGVQDATVYVFDDDETDDTYVIEEETDEDEEPFEDEPFDEDLSDEIDLLLLDQRHAAERN